MTCERCGSERIASINAKCSDLFNMSIGTCEVIRGDYVPTDYNIGGGDYVRVGYCLDCGQMEGDWPVEKGDIEDDTLYCVECGSDEVVTTAKFDAKEGGDVNHHHCRDCDHEWTTW